MNYLFNRGRRYGAYQLGINHGANAAAAVAGAAVAGAAVAGAAPGAPGAAPAANPADAAAKRDLGQFLNDLNLFRRNTLPTIDANGFQSCAYISCFLIMVAVFTSDIASYGKFYLPIIIAMIGTYDYMRIKKKSAHDSYTVANYQSNVAKILAIAIKIRNNNINVLGNPNNIVNWATDLNVASLHAMQAFNTRERDIKSVDYVLRYIAFLGMTVYVTNFVTDSLFFMDSTIHLVCLLQFFKIAFLTGFYHFLWYVYKTYDHAEQVQLQHRLNLIIGLLNNLIVNIEAIHAALP